MRSGKVSTGEFEKFLEEVGPRLLDVMTSMFGPLLGREAAEEVLAYGWEHWDRVRVMDKPVGYLFVVARDRVKKEKRRLVVLLDPVDSQRSPLV